MNDRKPSRADRIIAVYRGMDGPQPIHRIGEAVIAAGVYGDADREAMFLRAVHADVRKALKAAGEDGLPFAVQIHVDVVSEEGVERAQCYAQLLLCTREQAHEVIVDHIRRMADDWRRVEALVRFAESKWPEENWWSIAYAARDEWGTR